MKKHIPSAITVANIICGFLAIVIADLFVSSLLIIVCLFLDFFDGAAARALNAQSAMGKELDSLADMVSFGIAPAYLYYTLSPVDGWIGYIPPIFIVAAGALRLAKFNTLPDSKYFKGLAIPAMAYFMLGLLIAMHFKSDFLGNALSHYSIYFIIPLFMAYMMISPLEMFSLKDANKGLAKNKWQMACFLQFWVWLVIFPKLAIPISVLVYILLSVIETNLRNAKSGTIA